MVVLHPQMAKIAASGGGKGPPACGMALASGGACGGLKSFSHPRAAEKAVRIGKIVDFGVLFKAPDP